MSEKIKKGDFVEIEYTGLITEPEKIVFDTTDEAVAKKEGIHNPNMAYGPVTICIGEQQILKGLDSNIEGKELGKPFTVELGPEDAFGKKDAKMLKLVPLTAFKKQNINPVPGLQINIDDLVGTVKTIGGGRVIVDFNHPLSGKKVTYNVKINKQITDKAEQIKSYLMLKLNIKEEAFKVSISGDTALIEFISELPENLKDFIKNKLVEIIKIKNVNFGVMKKENKKEEKKENKKKDEKEEKKE